ncbi:MAG: ABC transporter ATP-binding protein [Chlamydiales bacterium]|nr:ABC transporter ATP-binding protein [Chlamydiales bacterium]
MSIIQTESLSFSYEDEWILQNVTVSVEANEFIGIIGPNGGGKTTLLKLIMGLLRPTQGSISVLGESPKAARKKIAYVPQVMRFDKHFPISVFELVLGGRLSFAPWWGGFPEKDKKYALNVLEQVNLIDFKDRPFGTLSGGQAQRALIARALASDPEILLLDEPTASVDVHAEADIYDILIKLKNNKTILMVTHDLKAIMKHVQRIFCVQKEVVVLRPEQVCEHFAIGLYHPPITPFFPRKQ